MKSSLTQFIVTAGLAAFILTVAAMPARAQSGPGLILSPWEDQALFDTQGSVLIEEGETDRSQTDFSLRLYDARGRGRLGTQRGAPVGGFDLTYLDFTSSDPAIPDHLSDQSLGVGMGLGRWRGFEFAATVGGGYAGDSFYSDEDAWYPQASLIVSRQFEGNARVYLTLSYNGNRTVFPDIPLPGITYSDQYGEDIFYNLGFPFSSLRWKPTERLELSLNYGIPLGFNARAEYLLTDRWSVFVGYDTHASAFHLDDDDEHRRLFFQQDRFEAGVQWQALKKTPFRSELTLAIGYAFDQELSRGFDLRDTDTVRDLNEDAYVRLGAEFDF